jgi:hypothetical protein
MKPVFCLGGFNNLVMWLPSPVNREERRRYAALKRKEKR